MDEKRRAAVVTPGQLAELDRQIERGSQFTQAVLQRTSLRVSEAEGILARLIDELVGQGLVDPGSLGLVADGQDPITEMDDDDDATGETVTSKITWPTIAIREDSADDARDRPEVDVDCDARMPVCKAVCCRLKFPLSAAEVDAGRVKWDIGHPYIIRHDAGGRCTHNDAGSGRCGVYDQRPGVCRTYSCANDPRIWSDFDGMVLNDEWIEAHLGPRDSMFLEAIVPPMEVPVEMTTKARARAGRGPDE